MASCSQVIGEQVTIGIPAALKMTGYIVDTVSKDYSANITSHTEDGDTVSKIIQDCKCTITWSMAPTTGDITTLSIGDDVTVDSVVYMLVSWSQSYSGGVHMVTLTVEKEDSMTY